MRRYIGAMPDTACLALPRRTKVLNAAINGRGSIVVMTVSSMSLTRPKRTSSADDEHVGGDRLGALHLDDGLLPAGRQSVVAGDDVDMAAPVGPAEDLTVTDGHLDRDAGRRRGEEGSPAPVVVGRAQCTGRVLPALGALGALAALAPEQDTAEDPDERRRAVAHVRDDPVAPAAAAEHALDLLMDGVLDDGGRVRS